MTTTHRWPAPIDRASDWDAGIAFETFLPTADKNTDLWSRTGRLPTPPDVLARVAAVPGAWRLLVLSEDWCGDAANTVPVLARLADEAPTLDLRLLARDGHLDLMDEHLTGERRSRSIPVALLLDADGREHAWWGPRPAPLQAWFLSPEAQALATDERYRELRKWYARDRGRTTLDEVVTMIELAARPLPTT